MLTKEDIPKNPYFYFPVLQALSDLGGSASNSEIEDKVAEICDIPQEMRDIVYEKSGSPIFSDRLSWARSYLKIYGALESGGSGIWILTPKGRDMDESDIVEVIPYVRLHSKRMRELSAATDEGETSDSEQLDWVDALLTRLRAMPPDAFERLCQRLLRESGFTKVEVTGRPGDGGIDGVGVLRVNLVSFQVMFQSKRYQGSVGSPAVRDFRGAMQGRADKGLIITTGTFTQDARAEAVRDGAPAIDLIDGEELCQLLKSLKLGVKIEMVEQVEVDEDLLASV